MFISAVSYLKSKRDELNELNVFPVPDGDTGDNMYATAEGGLLAISPGDSTPLCDVLSAIKSGMLLGARGNSGVILSQFFAGIADGLSGISRADAKALAGAMECGVRRAYDTVCEPKEGTILTVARDGVLYAKSHTENIGDYFSALCDGMESALKRTPTLLPILREVGVVDSGGAGLCYLFRGLSLALEGEISEEVEGIAYAKPIAGFDENSVMEYGYCTELLVQLQRSKTDPDSFDIISLRQFLSGIGTSVVAFCEGSLVKVHLHTFEPSKAIEHMQKFGEFIQVKIENMTLEHTDSVAKKRPATNKKATKSKAKSHDLLSPVTRNVTIIAVCRNTTQSSILKALGADMTINGKGGMSPSAKGFFDKIRAAKSEDIFIFPNDKNAILAAKQAAELSCIHGIRIIPSTSFPECYAALSVASDEKDPMALESAFIRTIGRMRCGTLCPAVRSCTIDGLDIKRGDFVGFMQSKAVLTDKDSLASALMLADMLISDKTSLFTVFRGKSADRRESARICSILSKKHPDIEVSQIYSADEIYHYILSAE